MTNSWPAPSVSGGVRIVLVLAVPSTQTSYSVSGMSPLIIDGPAVVGIAGSGRTDLDDVLDDRAGRSVRSPAARHHAQRLRCRPSRDDKAGRPRVHVAGDELRKLLVRHRLSRPLIATTASVRLLVSRGVTRSRPRLTNQVRARMPGVSVAVGAGGSVESAHTTTNAIKAAEYRYHRNLHRASLVLAALESTVEEVLQCGQSRRIDLVGIAEAGDFARQPRANPPLRSEREQRVTDLRPGAACPRGSGLRTCG